MDSLNTEVRAYWEKQPCGTDKVVTKQLPEGSPEWFKKIEEYRYTVEPFIHSVAQFTRHSGKKILEIGVGAGTDHLQWARAGLECYGVDLTEAAIKTTQAHLACYGLKSNLQRVDAEKLPFPDSTFDIVYSWGVIHHSEHPDLIIGEIKRVLKTNGMFIGMMYNRHSIAALKLWIRFGLLKGKPMLSLADIIWDHMESVGTKAYTVRELGLLFKDFSYFVAEPILTTYEKMALPKWLTCFFPNQWGWFIALKARK